MSNICSDFLKLHLVETRKWSLVVVLFAAESIVFVVVCISFLCCSCLEAPLHTKISWLLDMCSRGTLLASLNSSKKHIYYFYRVLPIFVESESISFCASTSLRPTLVHYGKSVLSYNLHAMKGICKEGWLGDFLIKFYFG